MPIVMTAGAMKALRSGDLLEVVATDPGSVADFAAWCSATGNELIEHDAADGVLRYVIRKR
jgi:tRNA 2-thiouridine synthesizing protein A